MRDTDFWRVPGSLTDLAGHSAWVNDLPDDPAAVREVVASLLIHPDHPALAESRLTDRGLVENQLRRAGDIVAAIRARVPDPTEAKDRSPADRVAGVCRHFAVVLVAVLRAKGVPARARNGVASYFRTEKWDNHWIVEWWNTDGHCWVRADAQLDENHRAALPSDVDPDYLPPGAFLNAGETWLGVRSGSIDPENCGGPVSWDMGTIRANVVRDLAALNKVELLAWDVWAFQPSSTSSRSPSRMQTAGLRSSPTPSPNLPMSRNSSNCTTTIASESRR